MKKFKPILLVLSLFITLSLLGCHPVTLTLTNTSRSLPISSLTYSNLLDPQTQETVANKLLTAGIPSTNISQLLEYVNEFNNKLCPTSPIYEGFKTISTSSVNYNSICVEYDYSKLATFQMDLDCRIIAFLLLKDTIQFEELTNNEDDFLFYDTLQIDENPELAFLKPLKQEFITLFSSIPVAEKAPQKSHILAIENTLAGRKFNFSNASHVALINLYLHDPIENTRYVDHTGVMVTTDTNLLFIEKVAPFLPYQVTQFNCEKDVINYLLKRPIITGDGTENPPIITKNNKVIYY